MFAAYFTWQVPPAHPTVSTVDPVPVLQVNGAASVLAKQLSPVAQHPITVVFVGVDAYDAVHVAAHEYVFFGVPVAVAAA